eukprot:COSAG01_NODE_965_length_12401_cov_3.496098_10_plen_606_part_00
MSYLPGVGKLVIFSSLRGCICVDPLDGTSELVAFALDPPTLPSDKEPNRNIFRRTPVTMTDGLAHLGVLMFHHPESSTIHFFYADGADWGTSKVTLSDVCIARLEVLSDTQLLVHETAGSHVQLQLPESVVPGGTVSLVPLEVERELSDAVELLTAEGHLYLGPSMPTPPIIAAALGAVAGGTSSHSVCGTDMMGGYTLGFHPDALLDSEAEASIFSFFKPAELLGDLSQPTEYHCTWLHSAQASVTVVARPNSVSIDVLDYNRGVFASVPLGPVPGEPPPDDDRQIAPMPGAEARSGGAGGSDDVTAPIRWQSWAMIVTVVELSDGRLCMLQRNGIVRCLELRESELAGQELEWLAMHGKSRGKRSSRGRRGNHSPEGGRSSRRHRLDDNDEEEEEEWAKDEWEEGTVIAINDDGTVDILLDAGETVEGLDPDVLDAEDEDIGIGTRIFVNGEDIEWDDDDGDGDGDIEGEDGPYEEEDGFEEDGEDQVMGVIESMNEDGTANVRLANGELLEEVDLDDMMPADGGDPSELGEGSQVMVDTGDGRSRRRGRGRGQSRRQGREVQGRGRGRGKGRGRGRGKGQGQGACCVLVVAIIGCIGLLAAR